MVGLMVLKQVMIGYGVSKVVVSGHKDFKAGDLVWGMIGWEEYSLISDPDFLIKINHPELPLSYYTGILGTLHLFSIILLIYLKNNHFLFLNSKVYCYMVCHFS
jgi:NADPH-dependent curcumin reductase CurA